MGVGEDSSGIDVPESGADFYLLKDVFNRGDQPAQISFRWDSLHLGANLGGDWLAERDPWAHSDVKI